MKRRYTVNFDFFVSPDKVDGFTRTYILHEKFAGNFLNTLRGMLPNMNIYTVRIEEV